MAKSNSASRTKKSTAKVAPKAQARAAAPAAKAAAATKPRAPRGKAAAQPAAKVADGAVSRPAKKNGSAAALEAHMMISHNDIARRAYEIWVAKGRPMGQDEQNWREAESELHSRG